MSKVTTPDQIGIIQDLYQGENEKVVVLVQDAHAIPDAQRNIQRMIDHLQKEYGLNLIGVEGASSPLDPQIFKSFPNQVMLKETFDQYFENGELTGTTASAIFNESPSFYQGIEDWPLYEEGLGLYLKATENDEQITEVLKSLKQNLSQKKKRVYSKKLLELDQALNEFHDNQSDLVSILKKLSEIKKPEAGSELSILMNEIDREKESQTSVEQEVKQIALNVKAYLLATKAKEDLTAFNREFQEFQTSRITPEAFASFLEETTSKNHFLIHISDRLSYLIKNHKRMRDIEGTRFFRDFERYAQSVKAHLFRNEEERKLDQESHQFDLIQKLARLELTRQDWNELKALLLQSNSQSGAEAISGRHSERSAHFRRRTSSSSRKVLAQKARSEESRDVNNLYLSPHIAFYQNAESRDGVFFKNLLSLMNEHHSNSSLLVAGGFHTEGLTQRLKENGISYLLISPRMDRLPEYSRYREQMGGDFSWKNYFEVEEGRVNIYKAFVRATRDQLLRHDDPHLLKNWRDQLIRDLVEEEKVAEVKQYTQFIDEVVSKNAHNELRKNWMAKVDQFVSGLRKLETKGQLTDQNIFKLLQPSTAATLTSDVMAPGDWTSLEIAMPIRAEVRAGKKPERLARPRVESLENRIAPLEWSRLTERFKWPFNIGRSEVRANLKTAVEIVGKSLLSKYSERFSDYNLGALTSPEQPEIGYVRYVSQNDLASIAELINQRGLGFLLDLNFGYSRVRINPRGHYYSIFHIRGPVEIPSLGTILFTEALVPDFHSTRKDTAIENLLITTGFNPLRFLELVEQTEPYSRIPEVQRNAYRRLAEALSELSLPPMNEENFRRTQIAGIFHELGEGIFVGLNDKARNSLEAQQLLNEWEQIRNQIPFAERIGIVYLKNRMKQIVEPEDLSVTNDFADQFALFMDPNSIYRDLGEELTAEEQAFFSRLIQFLQNENMRDGNAFLLSPVVTPAITIEKLREHVETIIPETILPKRIRNRREQVINQIVQALRKQGSETALTERDVKETLRGGGINYGNMINVVGKDKVADTIAAMVAHVIRAEVRAERPEPIDFYQATPEQIRERLQVADVKRGKQKLIAEAILKHKGKIHSAEDLSNFLKQNRLLGNSPSVKPLVQMFRFSMTPPLLQEEGAPLSAKAYPINPRQTTSFPGTIDQRIGTLISVPDLLVLKDGFYKANLLLDHLMAQNPLPTLQQFVNNILAGKQSFPSRLKDFYRNEIPWAEWQVGVAPTAQEQPAYIQKAWFLLRMIRILQAFLTGREAEDLRVLDEWASAEGAGFIEALKNYNRFTGLILTESMVKGSQERLERIIHHERLHELVDLLLHTNFSASDPRLDSQGYLKRGLQVFLSREGGFSVLWDLFGPGLEGGHSLYTESLSGLQRGDLSFADEFWVNTIYPSDIALLPERNAAYQRFITLIDQMGRDNDDFRQGIAVVRGLKQQSDSKAHQDLQALQTLRPRAEVRTKRPNFERLEDRISPSVGSVEELLRLHQFPPLAAHVSSEETLLGLRQIEHLAQGSAHKLGKPNFLASPEEIAAFFSKNGVLIHPHELKFEKVVSASSTESLTPLSADFYERIPSLSYRNVREIFQDYVDQLEEITGGKATVLWETVGNVGWGIFGNVWHLGPYGWMKLSLNGKPYLVFINANIISEASWDSSWDPLNPSDLPWEHPQDFPILGAYFSYYITDGREGFDKIIQEPFMSFFFGKQPFIEFKNEQGKLVPISVGEVVPFSGPTKIDLEGFSPERQAGLIREKFDEMMNSIYHFGVNRYGIELLREGLKGSSYVLGQPKVLLEEQGVLDYSTIVEVPVTSPDGQIATVRIKRLTVTDYYTTLTYEYRIGNETKRLASVLYYYGLINVTQPDGSAKDVNVIEMSEADKRTHLRTVMKQLMAGSEIPSLSQRLQEGWQNGLDMINQYLKPVLNLEVGPMIQVSIRDYWTVDFVFSAKVDGVSSHIVVRVNPHTGRFEKVHLAPGTEPPPNPTFFNDLNSGIGFNLQLAYPDGSGGYYVFSGMYRGIQQLARLPDQISPDIVRKAWSQLVQGKDLLSVQYGEENIKTVRIFGVDLKIVLHNLPKWVGDFVAKGWVELLEGLPVATQTLLNQRLQDKFFYTVITSSPFLAGFPELQGQIYEGALGLTFFDGFMISRLDDGWFVSDFFKNGDFSFKSVSRVANALAQFIHTTIHELVHATHITLFTPEQNARLIKLFNGATKEGFFSGAYASVNHFEYLAQIGTIFAGYSDVERGQSPLTRYQLFTYHLPSAEFAMNAFKPYLPSASYPSMTPQLLDLGEIENLLNAALSEINLNGLSVHVEGDRSKPYRERTLWDFQNEVRRPFFYIDTIGTFGTFGLYSNGVRVGELFASSHEFFDGNEIGYRFVVSNSEGNFQIVLEYVFNPETQKIDWVFKIEGNNQSVSLFDIPNNILRVMKFSEFLKFLLELSSAPPIPTADLPPAHGAATPQPQFQTVVIDQGIAASLIDMIKFLVRQEPKNLPIQTNQPKEATAQSAIPTLRVLSPALSTPRFASKDLKEKVSRLKQNPQALLDLWEEIAPQLKDKIKMLRKQIQIEVTESQSGMTITIKTGNQILDVETIDLNKLQEPVVNPIEPQLIRTLQKLKLISDQEAKDLISQMIHSSMVLMLANLSKTEKSGEEKQKRANKARAEVRKPSALVLDSVLTPEKIGKRNRLIAAREIRTLAISLKISGLRRTLKIAAEERLKTVKLQATQDSKINGRTFREESLALVNDFPDLIQDIKQAYTIALVLPEKNESSFAQSFISAITHTHVSTIAIVGKVGEEFLIPLKVKGKNVRPIKNLNRPIVVLGQPAVPTGILDGQSISQINEMFLPFWINMGDVNNPLVRDYVQQLQIVALAHTARILTEQPELLKNAVALRTKVVESLARFEGFESIISMDQKDGHWGFSISAAIAQAYLEHKSELAAERAA